MLYTRYPIVARALGLAAQPLRRVRERRYLAYNSKLECKVIKLFWPIFMTCMQDTFARATIGYLVYKINVNNGQNKFEVHISKNVAKMAILWPKIGQCHFGARASHGHNLAIFHQILTNEHTKMTSSLRRIEWNKILSSISLFYILVFWPHFCSEASHGQCCTYGLKTTLKLLVHVLAIMASSYLKIVFLQKSGLNPP